MAMLISVMSFAEEATLSFADKANRTSFGSTQQVWEQNGVKLTNDKAGYTNNLGDYVNPVRLYAKTTVTIECTKGNMTQILFVAGSDDYAKTLNTSLGTAFGTVTVSGSNVTLTPSTPAASVGAITMSAQVRLKSITVTYEKAESTEPTITCANASFGVVKVGSETTKELVVEAENLTEAITATLEKGTAFTVTGDLTTTGGTLTLAVIATEEGTYNDVLTLTSGTATKTVEISATVIVCDGEGTQEKPYSVADVKKLGNPEEIAWVEGYIVGTMYNNKLATDTVLNSNFVLATTAEDTVTLVPVALPSGEVRTDLNLVDNPGNLGKKIAVKGNLEAYFSMPGVRSVSEYEWVVEEPKYDMEIVCSNLKTMSEGNMTYFMGSSSDGMSIDLVVFGFEGKGTYEVEGSIDAGGEYFTLAGEAEYLYSEELEADALVAVVTANGAMSLKITMYKKTLVPTETIVVENMTKTIQSYGWMKQLTLDGEHETYGQVTLIASGCDGTYGTYAVTAWLGEDIELEGEGEWKNEGELDVLEVIAETADGKVLKIVGQTEYVAPVEPVSMYAEVEFTVDEEGILRVTGTTNDEVAVQLYVYGWNEVGYGTYGEGEVIGFIGDTEVANQQYTATIEQEGNVAYLHVILNDAEGNLYDLTAGGMALENPAAGAGSRTTVIVEEAEITTSAMFPTDLEIYGWSNDDREVVIALWDGTTKQYGEYTTDFVVEVDGEQYDLLENTVATYSLEDGLAVLRAAVAAGKDTLDLIVSGAPWVDPATAEPTDTVTLAFTKGTINVSFDGTATIKGGNSDLGVQIFTMGGDIYEGITSEQFNSYSSYLMIDWMKVDIYRGELKVVDLTNDVKVAYIGVLGADYKWYNITLTTADEIPTALDNINATVAPAKRINNGQLIIINNGVEYNAQGAIVK